MRKFPIKGFSEGILISIGEGDWKDIQSDLLQQIDSESTFFNQAKIAIDIGERELRAAQISRLRDALLDREVKLFAVLSGSKKSESNAATLGLATRSSLLEKKESRLSTAIQDGEPGLVIVKTVRGGAEINYDGHVIIMGDLNAGANIQCTGSVFIWGKLRGIVHAGIEGRKDVVVCAMQFNPIRLRIANIEYKDNKLIRKLRKKPLKISLEQERFVLDYWDS